jgi:hypothetical protein
MVFHSRNPRRWVGLLAAVLLGCAAWAEGAPEIRLQQPEGTVRAGEAFEVGVVAHWSGESSRFVVTPGELEAPAWGEAAWDRVEARQTADGTELTFFARFTAKEPGAISVQALHLNYIDPSAPPAPALSPDPAADPAAPAPAPVPVQHTLQADGFELQVRADYRWAYPYIFLCVMGLGFVLALVSIWYGRRKSAATPQEDALAPWRTVEDALHNARRHRLDGDFYKFYRELQRLVNFVGAELKSEFGAKLDKRVEEIGFQGQAPTEDELEGIVKDIERALARWKEGQAA